LPPPQELLRPGMTASAEIEVERLDRAVVVPLAGVLEATKSDDEDKPDRVFVVDAPPSASPAPASPAPASPAPVSPAPVSPAPASTGATSAAGDAGDAEQPAWVVREVAVRLGPADGDSIAVLDGVKPGQRIVEGPFRALKDLEDGARVRQLVKDDEGPAAKKKDRKKKAP
jgi:HlyD family secretion protein